MTLNNCVSCLIWFFLASQMGEFFLPHSVLLVYFILSSYYILLIFIRIFIVFVYNLYPDTKNLPTNTRTVVIWDKYIMLYSVGNVILERTKIIILSMRSIIIYVYCQNVPLDKWNARCQRGGVIADFQTKQYLNRRINHSPSRIWNRKYIVILL